MEAERKCEELIRFKPRAGSKGEKKKKRTGESGGGMGGQGGGDRLYSFPVTGKNDPRGSGNGEAGSETS